VPSPVKSYKRGSQERNSSCGRIFSDSPAHVMKEGLFWPGAPRGFDSSRDRKSRLSGVSTDTRHSITIHQCVGRCLVLKSENEKKNSIRQSRSPSARVGLPAGRRKFCGPDFYPLRAGRFISVHRGQSPSNCSMLNSSPGCTSSLALS